MGQLKIDGTGHGKPVMPFGSDGADWYAVLIDTLGHLQVDVVTAALGSDAATETTLLLIKGYIDALETLLAGGLPAALDTGALKVKEQSPLTGFATAANQAIIVGYIDALETLLAGGLPAALDSGALKTKEQSPLTGFATSANQTTMITALQLIDDLRAALGSVATDKILVASKSGDKIFGFESVVIDRVSGTITGANGYLESSAVPAGKVWLINTMAATDMARALTGITFTIRFGADDYTFHVKVAAIPAAEQSTWAGYIYLPAGATLRCWFAGSVNGDGSVIWCTGLQMNAP